MSLALYKPLGDNDEQTRLDAAKQLTTELSVLITGDRTDKAKSDIDYALNRLSRGLASGRESARPGFAVVLTELVSTLLSGSNPQKWDISLDTVIERVKANTDRSGGDKKEERDYHLGRLFGLQSLIQSNALFASLEHYTEVLTLLFELGQKKPWLRESCAWTICSTMPQWPAENSREAAEITFKTLVDSDLAKSSEGVGIWLALQAYHPEVQPPKNVWPKGSPLTNTNLALLAKALKEGGSKDGGETGKTKGSWNPKLSFVWDVVMNVYCEEGEGRKNIRDGKDINIAPWEDFWRVCVDESLFSASSSEERKFWGFLVFVKALERVKTPDDLSALFTRNFMRCLINQLSDSERYLNKAATKATRAMLARAEAAPWTAPVMVKQLISQNGTPNFDHLTKGGTVVKMLSKADEAGLIEIVDSLHQVILDPLSSSPDLTGQEAEKAAHVRRTWAADQITNIVKNGNSVKAESWLSKTIEMFVTFGYFDIVDKHKPKAPIPTNTQGTFRARLMSCLTHLIMLKDERGETWPCRAVGVVNSLSKKTDKYTLAIELDDTIQKAVKKACKSLERIKKKRLAQASNFSEATTQLLSFELLYSLIILQVYNGEADALGVLDDLQMIYDKFAEKDDDGEEEVDASELLIEILLSFISKPSNLLKRLAQTVFQAFCSTIGFKGLQSMFEVLDTDENVEGQQALFDNDDDEAEEEEDDDDVEMLDGSDDEGLDSDVEIISSPSDDEDDATADNEAEQKRLEAALAAVLQPPDEEADSDSDADMSDDAMLKVDGHLSKIFAQRVQRSEQHKSKKNQKKEAKELIVGFKTRVLELLEIYVKTLPSSPLALEALLPCIELSRNTQDKNLAARSLNVIKALAASIKSSSTPPKLETDEQRQRAWILLHLIYDVAGDQKPGPLPQPRKAATSQAAIVCAKAILQGHPEEMDKLVDSWAQGIKRWLSERDFNPDKVFFSDLLSWASSVRTGLLDGVENFEGNTEKGKKKDAKKEQKEGAKNIKGGKENGLTEKVKPETIKVDKIEKAQKKKKKGRRETKEVAPMEGDVPEDENKPKKKRKSKK